MHQSMKWGTIIRYTGKPMPRAARGCPESICTHPKRGQLFKLEHSLRELELRDYSHAHVTCVIRALRTKRRKK